MLIPLPYVHAGMGALFSALSLPLILRKVPMNTAYGFRLRKAFVSPSNWYALNAFGGKFMFAAGLALLAFAFASRDLAPPPQSPWAPLFLVAPLLVMGAVGFIVVGAYARSLPDR